MLEPPRTFAETPCTPCFSSYLLAGETRCAGWSSGWFDCTEPSLATALQGKQGVQGAYALVRGGSSTANLLEPTRTTTSQS